MARNDIYYLATNINHAFMLYEEHATDIMMPEYIKYLKLYGSTEQYFYPLINADSGNGEQVYYILAITDNYPKTGIGVDSISVNGMDVKMIIIPKKRIGLYNSIIMQNKILEYNKGFYKSAAKIISIYNGIYDNLIDVMYTPSQSITKYNLIYENEGIIPTIIKIIETLYYATIACSGVKCPILVENIIEYEFTSTLRKPILSAINNLLECDASIAFKNTIDACNSIGTDNIHELIENKLDLANDICRVLLY